MLISLLDFLFPPQCLSCNAAVLAQGTLCLPCWQQVQFITDPVLSSKPDKI
jgi:predicted amidophosphoribosyltransferase